MSHLLSFIKTKGKVSAFLAFAALLASNQLFAQAVNTATVARPAGLVLTCVNGPVGTGLSYTSGAPVSCSATDTDTLTPKITATKTVSATHWSLAARASSTTSPSRLPTARRQHLY